MSHDDDFSVRPAVVGMVFLPAVFTLFSIVRQLFHVRFADPVISFTALGVTPDPVLPEFAGLMVGAGLAAVVGPHLTMMLAIGLLGVAWLSMGLLPFETMHGIFTFVEYMGLLGGLASLGVTAGGGAPGIRYASVISAWCGWALSPLLARVIAQAWNSMLGVGMLGLALLLLTTAAVLLLAPTGSWWFMKRHPRPAAPDSTYRVAGTATAAFLVLISVVAVDTLRLRHLYAQTDLIADMVSAPALAHHVALAVTGGSMAALLLGLQLFRKPARFGIYVGAGCLAVSLAGVWVWTSRGEWLILISILAGIGHALVIPWAWARSTSDTHWRLAGAFAAIMLFAPHAVEAMGSLWPIASAMGLAIAAVPVGAIGWFGDDWVYGDVPGSTVERRGRR